MRKEQPERVIASKRRYYEKNKEKVKAAAKAYRAQNHEKYLDYNRRYQRERYEADPNYWRAKGIKSTYGITMEDYELLMVAQERCCAICRRPLGDLKPHIDHCHTTGKVRGILCRGCNVGIAHLQDDPLVALRASEYLSRHKVTCLTQI